MTEKVRTEGTMTEMARTEGTDTARLGQRGCGKEDGTVTDKDYTTDG